MIASRVSFSAMNARSSRVSMGTLAFMSVYRAEDLATTIMRIRNELGVRMYATSPEGRRRIDDAEVDGMAWGLVVGNEDLGSSTAVLNSANDVLVIPQRNGDSLSVSVAGGIGLWELAKKSKKTYEQS